MSHMAQYIYFRALLPQTTMLSAWRLPHWVLSPEETQALHEGGHGTSPDLIYARGVPDTFDPSRTNFGKNVCTLILI